MKADPYSDGSLVDEVMNLMLQVCMSYLSSRQESTVCAYLHKLIFLSTMKVQAHDPQNADVQEVLGVL